MTEPAPHTDFPGNAAFEALYRNHYSRLFTLAFRITGTRENAEDVLQTSFMNAYRGFADFQGKSTPYTWLYRIVLNTARALQIQWEKMPMDSYAESNGITLEDAYAHLQRYSDTEDLVLTERIRESCLQMFMNCMPPKYRSVFTLRAMLQLSSKDTAEILEISEDAVKTNLHRARKLARDHLRGRCSLIKPGAMCDCRAFAGYVRQNNRMERIQDIAVIRRREVEAVDTFTDEMAEIIETERLYAVDLQGEDFDGFKARLKQLRRDGNLALLDY